MSLYSMCIVNMLIHIVRTYNRLSKHSRATTLFTKSTYSTLALCACFIYHGSVNCWHRIYLENILHFLWKILIEICTLSYHNWINILPQKWDRCVWIFLFEFTACELYNRQSVIHRTQLIEGMSCNM